MAARRFSLDDEKQPKRKLDRESLRELLGLYSYLKPYRWKFAAGLLCLLLSALTSLAFPYAAGQLIDAASGKTATNILAQINVIAAALIGILLVQATFSFFRILLFAEVGEKSLADLRADLYGRLILQPMSFFANQRVGELNSRISSDISLIQDTFTFTLAEFLRGMASMFIGIGIIVFISPSLTLVMLSVFPILVFVAVVFGRFIRKLAKRTQDRLAEAGVIVEETLQGVQTVKTFTNERYEFGRYRKAVTEVVKTAIEGAKYRGAFASFIIFGLFGAIVLVLWQGTRLVAVGEITVGQLTSFVIYTTFVGGAMGGFSEQYAQLQKTLGATERVRQLLREKQEPINIREAEKAPDNVPSGRLTGAVKLEAVTFRYPSRPEIPVLSGIDLEVRPGEKIAIVGPSGAGKTTLISLLTQLYPPESGVLLFDGHPADTLPLGWLRGQMALVPQDVLLFGGTIRENIAYGKLDARQEEIEAAAKQANAHEFIIRFPDGYDTIVGERGVKLSGGQRQRVAIARAVLRDPSILVLDEATSSLDSESEHLVQQALDTLMEGRTTFIIAHRLSTVRNANRILVLDKGHIVESGSHEELIQIPDGLYQRLATLQFATEAASAAVSTPF
jgi:ABC transporter fused permease/ATP-binding protein